MSAATSRPRGRRLAVALAAVTLALGPAVAIAPSAYADTTTPPPISEEPPGGATCAPDLPQTDCQQEGGATTAPATVAPTPAPTKAAASAKPASTKPAPATSTSPSATPAGATVTSGQVSQDTTGSATGLPTTLAVTGPAQALVWGSAGAGLLVLGGALLLVARPRPVRIER